MAISVQESVRRKVDVTVNKENSLSLTTKAATVVVPSTPIYKVEVSSKGPRGEQGAAGDGAGGLLDLDDLQDVELNFATLSEDDILVYNGSQWVNQELDFLKNVVEDETPQLGGDLDLQQNKLFTSFYAENDGAIEFTTEDIQLTPKATGFVTLDGRIKLKRFSSPPAPALGAIYANDVDELFYGVSS
jgi:hypothetical protein